MFGEYHPLTQRPSLGKIVWGMTLPQIVVILIGGKLSYTLALAIPPLPISNPVLARIFCLIPLALVAGLLFIREQKTGMLLYKYLYYLIKFKIKKDKIFIWKMS